MSANYTINEIFGSIPKELILQWHNINFIINEKESTKKIILNNVSGKTKNKSLTALMGPSGSGKTTLLECIACRAKNVQGAVTLNDTLMSNDIMPEISGFLPQVNITSENFTVTEYMQFMCTLKLHKILDTFQQQNRVSSLIHKFGLKKCLNTEISKLSGGERKKLFLIDLLLSDPAIIFCDEPTTGLDGYSAFKMVQILKELASTGKIVILSIHQPSPDIIKYFDQIIMLSQGSVILHGNTKQISDFFTNLGIICPISYNIAEFYIKQISVIPGQEQQCIENIKNLKNKFQIIHNSENHEEVYWREVKIRKRLKCSLFTQFRWLLWRTRIDAKREILTILISYLVTMFVASVMALFYSSSESKFNDVQNTRGYLYLSASELFFATSYSVIYTFPKELPIFLAETDLYSSVVYYLVKIISLIPEAIIYAYSFLAIICFSVQSYMDFMLYLNMGFVMSVALCTTIAYGFFISAIFKSIDYIKVLKAPLDIIFMITGGIFLDLQTLSYGLIWIKYLSSLYYSYENLSILQFERIVRVSNPNQNETIILESLHNMGINYENYYFNLYCLVILAIVMHVISCFILKQRRKNFNSLSRG